MKKITSFVAAFVMTFGIALSFSTPTYAAENCPPGSLQHDKATYKTADTDTVSDLTNASSDSEGHFTSSPVLSSLSQCNMDARNASGKQMMGTVNDIINAIIGVMGIVTVVIIILGGVQYTTSAGDPGKVKKAKDTILYGIIGLIVALLAFAIVNFVLSGVFGN